MFIRGMVNGLKMNAKRTTLWLLLQQLLFHVGHQEVSSLSLSAATSTLNSPPTHRTATEHIHEFWGRPRSSKEIQNHVQICMDYVEEVILAQQPKTTSIDVEIVSSEPPLIVIHDFLPAETCDELIEQAKNTGDMQRSKTGVEGKTCERRTSTTVWLKDHQCPGPLRCIADKVAMISGLPPQNMENLQVVRYEASQSFQLHTDHQDEFNDLERRGRLATCLIYLAEPSGGGETWFPGIDPSNEDLVITTTKGSAVFFFNTVERPGCEGYSPEMFLHTDTRLKHAGLPVADDSTSEKWICNRWIHPIDFGGGVVGTNQWRAV